MLLSDKLLGTSLRERFDLQRVDPYDEVADRVWVVIPRGP